MKDNKKFVPKLNGSINNEIQDTNNGQYVVEMSLYNGKKISIKLTKQLNYILNLIDGERSIEDITNTFNEKLDKNIHYEEMWNIISTYFYDKGLVINQQHKHVNFTLISETVMRNISEKLIFLFSYLAKKIMIMFLIFCILYLIKNFKIIELYNLKLYDFTIIFTLIIFSILIHEVGHAVALTKNGIEFGSLNISVVRFFPTIFLTINKVERVDYQGKIEIFLGGIYFELLYIICLVFTEINYNSRLIELVICYMLFSISITLIPKNGSDGHKFVEVIRSHNSLYNNYHKITLFFNKIYTLYIISVFIKYFYRVLNNWGQYFDNLTVNIILTLYGVNIIRVFLMQNLNTKSK